MMQTDQITAGIPVTSRCRDHTEDIYFVVGWAQGLWIPYVCCRRDDRLFYFRADELDPA